MAAKIVFAEKHKFQIVNPNPKPQSQILIQLQFLDPKP